MEYRIESYRRKHRKDVLRVFDSNVPAFFGEEERKWLIEFLDEPEGPNFVLLHQEQLVGFGGYEISDFYDRAVLTFGMLHGRYHKRGLGKYLLAYRLLHIARHSNPSTHYITVDTTPPIAKFFEHFGFTPVSVWKKGYRSGFDMHLLRYDLTTQNILHLEAIMKNYE